MKCFVVFDPATGAIKRTGTCSDDDLDLQAQDGEGVIEGAANDDEHMIVGGKIVEIPKHLRPQPAAPSVTDLRAREYPPIRDQLDAIWKGGAELEAMRAKVMAVKEKYPKPEGGKP